MARFSSFVPTQSHPNITCGSGTTQGIFNIVIIVLGILAYRIKKIKTRHISPLGTCYSERGVYYNYYALADQIYSQHKSNEKGREKN